MTQPQMLKKIYKVSKKEKTEVYAVGGVVRDALLGKKDQKDLDFVVLGSGLEFAKKFAAEFEEEEASLVEFPEFGTARVVFFDSVPPLVGEGKGGVILFSGNPLQPPPTRGRTILEIEFAGARSEAYRSESRKPVVKPATLEQDLSRRDFTVNAMARKVIASGLSKKIIDPYGGQKDLKEKILRTPFEPNDTFSEDPLRILRAARFAARLGFGIDAATLRSMHDNRARLSIISAERIRDELFALLHAPSPSVGLLILYHTQVLDEFLPEVSALAGVEDVYGHTHKDNLSHTFKVVDNVAEHSDNVLLRLAGLLHDIGKPGTKQYERKRGWTFDMHEHLGRKMVRHIGRRLRMSVDDTEYVARLVRWHMQPINLMDEGVTDSAVRRLIVNLKDELPNLLILCRSDITTGNPKKLERRLKNYDYLERRVAEVVESDKLRAFQSPLRGEEIMEMTGLKPGPTIGKIKKAVEEAILDGVIKNDYDDAKIYFEKIKDDFTAIAQEWEKR